MRSRANSTKKVASDRLKAIAETVASGGVVVPGIAPLATRNVLLSDQQRSSPSHHILAETLKYVPRGRETFVGTVLRAARNGDSDASAWMRVFEGLLPSEQKVVDLDAVCEACGVTPNRLMAIVVSEQMTLGHDVAEFVAAVYHPKVVHQTARSAMRIGGEHAGVAQKDREMMLQHGRFISGPKGINVNVTAEARSQAAAAAAQSAPSVPTFSESVLGAQRSHIVVQRQLAEENP